MAGYQIIRQNTGMEETMSQINGTDETTVVNKRDNLINEMSKLEKDIRVAREVVLKSNEHGPLYTSISPEKANQQKRDLVFLNKDLARVKLEFEELDR